MKFKTLKTKDVSVLQFKQPLRKSDPEVTAMLESLKDAPQGILVYCEDKKPAAIRSTIKKYAERLGIYVAMQTTVDEDAILVKITDESPRVIKRKPRATTTATAAAAPVEEADDDDEEEDEE